MLVVIEKSFPYIHQITREVVVLQPGQEVDIEDSLAAGWIKSDLAKPVTEKLEPVEADKEEKPKPKRRRSTKAVKPEENK